MKSRSDRSETMTALVLLILTLIPAAAGISRLVGLSSGGPVTPSNARFFASPLPVILHIFSATLYCGLGALQIWPAFRTRFRLWHRNFGRFLVPCGMVAALSGLWMTVAYPLPADLQGPLLFTVRLFVGAGMFASLTWGWWAMRKKDLAGHRTGMLFAMALGQGAGMQVVVMLPWMLVLGTPVGLTYDLLMSLAWAINLGLAALVLRLAAKPARTADK